jgi:hypothetical protein
MGAFLEKPNTIKHNENGEGNGLRFGVSSMQGKCLFLCFISKYDATNVTTNNY